MSTLNAFLKLVAFDDQDPTNAPQLQALNWNRQILSVPVESPANNKYVLPALANRVVFDGVRQLSYDNSTTFSVSLSPLSSSRYRLSWVSGTNPAFRMSRTVNLSGGNVTIAVLSNQTATVTSSLGAVFGAVQVGDDVFIPGVSTGDTALFNPLNEGLWTVLAATTTQLTLTRETGTVFEGYGETKGITNNNQFLVYSSDGVQYDDVVLFSSGFAPALLHSYEIVTVTSKFIEFESSAPLPQQTVAPGVASMTIYSQAKRFVYLETDQEVIPTVNGVVYPPIIPFSAGNPDFPGLWAQGAIVYSLSLTNKSTQQANVRVITVE